LLSEGINLQQGFNALLHYDLPWNPNRLEQREGRIDRFGQQAETVEVALLYGSNNPLTSSFRSSLSKSQRNQEVNRIAVPFPRTVHQLWKLLQNPFY